MNKSQFDSFQKNITRLIGELHGQTEKNKILTLDCILPLELVSLETLKMIDRFRPFGIGNRKPLFLLENLTLKEIKYIGKD
jgi:single-stranded-DNA-specific exonuclease